MSVILLENGSKLLLEDGGLIVLELDAGYVGGYGSGLYSKGLYGQTRLKDGTPVAIYGASTLGAYAERLAIGAAIVEAVSSSFAMSRVGGGSQAKVFATSDVRSNGWRVMSFKVEAVSADSLVKIAPTLLARATAVVNAASDFRADSNASLVFAAQIHAVSSILAKGRGIYLPEQPVTAEWLEQEGLSEIWTASNPDETIWNENNPALTDPWTPAPDNTSLWKEAAL